jgi:hypothetical protein
MIKIRIQESDQGSTVQKQVVNDVLDRIKYWGAS